MNNPLPPAEQHLGSFYEGAPGRMLQLGNKRGDKYARYFESLGWAVTMVDLNGNDGALALDLTKAGALGALGGFDLVTNFGTTEHVPMQEPCWRNIHAAVKVGGMLLSATPLPGHWPKHGRFYPSAQWFIAFAAGNGYESRAIYWDDLSEGLAFDRMLVCAALRKLEALPFAMPPERFMFINETGTKVGAYT